ncbi:hypothetical protein RDWZM_007883 [Blomia tropicalis]|uniref:Fatty acid desaturase domain-containing protein n=1 Tax=Blomia tropicalis TaxID=40697 RepID=A0A9Q0RJI8_BLOTA|nr:hypothetical protein RDWZM_007883 [Blomia tropicalis]
MTVESRRLRKSKIVSPPKTIINDEDQALVKDENFITTKHEEYKSQIVWRNVFTMSLLHILGTYGWIAALQYGKWQSFFWLYFIGHIGGLGVQCGAHRLWTHRAYKAHWTFRVLLMIMHTIALQDDLYHWVRDHRIHHKYSETDADPHNSRRGFFFAHVGWLMVRKHPLVKVKGAQQDLSDLWNDPVVRFQRRFYIPLVLLFWGCMPVLVMVYGWNESWWIAIFGNFFRYVVSLHQAWFVNSSAHLSGHQFYDRSLQPRENYFVTYLAMGEGYHNYHHAFPWDYSASEHGWKDCFNLGTAFIDAGGALGLVWDRKVVDRKIIESRIERTGDRSIIPSSMSPKNRKPLNPILEYVYGILVTSWMLWGSLLLRAIFYKGDYNSSIVVAQM